MKLWASLTVLLYLAVVVILFIPIASVGFGKSLVETSRGLFADGADGWGWIFFLTMGLCQTLLLFVPVRRALERPVSRRQLWVPLATGAFLFSLLTVAGVCSLVLTLQRKDSDFIDWMSLSRLFVIIGVLWTLWGFVFWRCFKNPDPAAIMNRLAAWLLRGSILELLVAVPCHIYLRHRDDCCAPGVSFAGITAGYSIMLLSFGPGVFFLFARRIARARLRPSHNPL